MVTKEDVEKARADYYDVEAATRKTAGAFARIVENSWRNYQKLKREFEENENGSKRRS